MWWLLVFIPVVSLPSFFSCLRNRERKLSTISVRSSSKNPIETLQKSSKRNQETEKKLEEDFFKNQVKNKGHSSSTKTNAAIRADEKATALAMTAIQNVSIPLEIVPVKLESSFFHPAKVTIHTEPTEVLFAQFGGLHSVNLVNSDREPLAFKVKCSDTQLYRVKPVFGLVPPGQMAKIEILRANGNLKQDRLIVVTAKMTMDNAKKSLEVAPPEARTYTVVPLLVEA